MWYYMQCYAKWCRLSSTGRQKHESLKSPFGRPVWHESFQNSFIFLYIAFKNSSRSFGPNNIIWTRPWVILTIPELHIPNASVIWEKFTFMPIAVEDITWVNANICHLYRWLQKGSRFEKWCWVTDKQAAPQGELFRLPFFLCAANDLVLGYVQDPLG